MSSRGAGSHPCVGTWKVLESTCRFLPVGALLRVSPPGSVEVWWSDASATSSLQLFDGGTASGERLVAEFEKEDPHSGQPIACRFSMVRQPGTPDVVYGLLRADDGRGDSSTGAFVAEETDTDAC